MAKQPKNTPSERYARDVAGMPVYAAKVPLAILLGEESMVGAVPGDDEECAIAKGCRVQLQTPFVSVGRSRTDLAMPHPNGVVKIGFGSTRWAVIRYENPASARRVVIAADLNQLDSDGVVVELKPPRPTTLPGRKRAQNTKYREARMDQPDGRGKVTGGGEDKLTLLGVRNLAGQRRKRVGDEQHQPVVFPEPVTS